VSPGTSAPERRLVWRPRALLLLGTACLLLLAAVLLRNPIPLFLALPLLLAGPAAAFGGPRDSPKLSARWGVEGSSDQVLVTGSVVAPRSMDARNLVLEVPCPPGLVEVSAPQVDVDRPEARIRLTWRAQEPSIVVVPPPRMTWRDPAGLVERTVDAGLLPLVVERYPPELHRIGAIRLRRTMVLPGETLSRHIGARGEFFGIRAALPEDPPRNINWKASARAGHLLANEFQLDRTGDVLLVLDTRTTSLGPEIDGRLLAISRAAAAGIAASFLRVKARVGLGVFGEFLAPVPLAAGRGQPERIRSALLAARLHTERAPSERCAVALGRYFPTGVTTILFSSLVDEDVADLLPHLRRRGFPVVALSPSPLPAILSEPVLGAEEEAIVSRFARLLRRGQVADAWREAPTIDWDDYWSLGQFVEFLRRPATRRIG
jgi:uncharacterized protein (DUF58 family)